MDKRAALAWFGELSGTDKAVVLADVMHELTIVVRSLFHDFANDCEKRSRSVYGISELNHRLTAAASAMIKNIPTYSDNDLVDMLFDQAGYPELVQYFPFVLEQVFRRSGHRAIDD